MRILLLLLAAAGALLAMGKMFFWGDQSVAYGSYVPWGLWVAAYSFMVTLSAGAAFVSCLYYVFGLQKYQPWARNLLKLALISLLGAMPLIAMDLGHPLRALSVLWHPGLGSFLPWAVYAYILFLIAGGVLLRREKAEQNIRYMALSVLALAVVFLSCEALHFGTVVARPSWNSALVIPLFFASAVTLGFAALTLLSKAPQNLRVVLLVHLVVVDLMEVGQLVVKHTSATPALEASYRASIESPLFWVFIGLGMILPLTILFSKQAATPMLKAAAGSVVLALFIAKYEFVTTAFASTPFAELPQAFSGPGLSTQYVPSLVELGVTVGVLAAAALVFLWISPVTDAKSSR